MIDKLEELVGSSDSNKIRNAIDSAGKEFNQIYDSISLVLLPQNPVLIRPTAGSDTANSIYSLDLIKQLSIKRHPQTNQNFTLEDVYHHPYAHEIEQLASEKETLVQKIASGKIEDLAIIEQHVSEFFSHCNLLEDSISNAFKNNDEPFLYAEQAFSKSKAPAPSDPPADMVTRYVDEMSGTCRALGQAMRDEDGDYESLGIVDVAVIGVFGAAILLSKSTGFLINELEKKLQPVLTPSPPPPIELQETHRMR